MSEPNWQAECERLRKLYYRADDEAASWKKLCLEAEELARVRGKRLGKACRLLASVHCNLCHGYGFVTRRALKGLEDVDCVHCSGTGKPPVFAEFLDDIRTRSAQHRRRFDVEGEHKAQPVYSSADGVRGCVFCRDGGVPLVEHIPEASEWRVVCRTCGARGPHTGRGVDEAIKWWNGPTNREW